MYYILDQPMWQQDHAQEANKRQDKSSTKTSIWCAHAKWRDEDHRGEAPIGPSTSTSKHAEWKGEEEEKEKEEEWWGQEGSHDACRVRSKPCPQQH
jgi:hypothetical protein